MNAPVTPSTQHRRKTIVLATVVAASVVAAALATGIVPRLHATAALDARTASNAAPVVAVVQPRHAPATTDLTLPADVQAYEDAAVRARVSGYLRRWYVDIGTPVKAGQLLADIDAPEIADQLRQARADVATAAANFAIAQQTATRWRDMLAAHSVAQQDADQKTAEMEATRALLAAANANVSRLTQLLDYTHVRAPFDGTITARNVDIGALVDAGSSNNTTSSTSQNLTQGQGHGAELFHLSQGSRVRAYVQVPQGDSALLDGKTEAWLTLPQWPGRKFPATVARNAGAIDPVTRTLRVELDADGQDGSILPGAYAEAHLSLQAPQPGFDLPASTLVFLPRGTFVAVVDAASKLRLVPVALGRDFGSHIEIRSGLQGDERVVLNPGDAVVEGTTVRVAADGTRGA
ncbi:efflux RND transporter periplasmic adaptor subunit [Cupriavidus plantarum]|uniref:RND family efflux transporter MFP subunit n=1 Tax=Cupriavidus plantarum TaxID=942865 RepID=A0A316ES78_9BURK|nr:efflux RND transporter periplasmic adaptor subunit [Cupriavidus plantarum]PWK35304.1 RND family efflux transporter MFP subunit [Cupriavidus plantarum]RLK39170.1 RND family efflux transporter MFP subunit [Cupriavidus plantarum]